MRTRTAWVSMPPTSPLQSPMVRATFVSEPDADHTLQTRRAELCSKSLHDPTRIPLQPTPPVPPTPIVEQVPSMPPVQAPLPHSLNRLKAEGLRTILEEKQLSTDIVVDRYPEEFYAAYVKLVPKGKKKASSFKSVDHVVARGRKVKCSNTDINEVLGCIMNVIHYFVDRIQKNTLDDLKGWLVPLISDITLSWIEAGVPIKKKDLNVAARYWFGFISNTLMSSRTSRYSGTRRLHC
uniref:Putative plant transposon protein domain-containing protein n=1 Tax=Solanum tuberosum TaxID=4113 RepID=M1DWJ0_SOLTU